MNDNVNNPRKEDTINFVGWSAVETRFANVKRRAVKIDGLAQIITKDIQFDRYNFEIEDGIITKQWMG